MDTVNEPVSRSQYLTKQKFNRPLQTNSDVESNFRRVTFDPSCAGFVSSPVKETVSKENFWW